MTENLNWYAVHTKANGEKLACDALRRKGFVPYLPSSTVRVRHARRTQIVSRPLFRRYAFVGLDAQHPPFAEVRKTWGVDWLVTNVDKPVVVRARDVELIRRAEAEGAFDETRPAPVMPVAPGDQVEVLAGPFAGLVAEIIAAPSERRIEIIFKRAGVRLAMPLASLKKAS